MDSSMNNVPRRRKKRPLRSLDGSPYRQTDRDLWLLEALAKMQFLTTRQIARLLFNGSQSAANKRLRKLLDSGWVRVWVPSLNRDNIYGLTPLGRRLLLEGLVGVDAAARCPRQLDGRIDHLLAVNAVRIALATTVPDSDGELLWWRSDWDLRAHSRQRTIPDGLFAIRWPGLGDYVFALEVEHGTRAPRSFQAKLLRYSAVSSHRGGIYGETNPVVLVVGNDPTWLARYRAALAPMPVRVTIGFASLANVERHGAIGAVWQTLTDDRHHSLRTLATLPYRSEPSAPELRAKSRPCAACAAHDSASRTSNENK